MLTLIAASLLAAVLPTHAAAATKHHPSANEPVRSCESLTELVLPDTTIDSAEAHPGDDDLPPSCRVHASVTHPPAGDDVNIDVWLPTQHWNGRFQGTGGGGWSGGFVSNLPGPLRDGYATASTDTGHVGDPTRNGSEVFDGSFALNPDGSLNRQLIRDHAYLGIHDMTVVAKTLIRAFYEDGPRYSYFNGCSTGGRQGIMEAQRYPRDYDGIHAASPAVNWTKLMMQGLWGHLAMLEAENFLPQCKFAAFTEAAIEHCDAIDGIEDGVIGDPGRCDFDPGELVGTETACGTITKADAEVMRKAFEGPRGLDGSFLWYGLEPGMSVPLLHYNTVTGPDGATTGVPVAGFVLDWVRYWLLRDPEWDWTTITRQRYERLFAQSVEQFDVISTDNPDLREFRRSGGKIIMWHGWSDAQIYPRGSVDYYERVVRELGGRAKTNRFLRLFMAPGVDHCGGGPGAAPDDPFGELVQWVEKRKAPRMLNGVRRDADGNPTMSRPICRYPRVARYKGRGDTGDADSFVCAKRYRRR